MRVMIATGGSGGHIFPALTLARVLRKENDEVHFAGSFGVFKKQIEAQNFSLTELPLRGLSGNSRLEDLKTVLHLIVWTIKSRVLVKRIRPDVIVGFGGYGALLLVLAGWMNKIPSVIHEQNVIPGRANAFLSRFVQKIAVSFSETCRHFPLEKCVITGCPVNLEDKVYDRHQVLSEWGLIPDRLTILVMGGSQGSRRINQEWLRAADLLKEDLSFQAIHISGTREQMMVRQGYEEMKIPAVVFDFCQQMDKVYTAADIAISRAGAVFINESGLHGLPVIFIPYPRAGGHQKFNAEVYVREGGGTVLPEEDLTPARLHGAVRELAGRNLSKKRVKSLASGFALSDAGLKLARVVHSL